MIFFLGQLLTVSDDQNDTKNRRGEGKEMRKKKNGKLKRDIFCIISKILEKLLKLSHQPGFFQLLSSFFCAYYILFWCYLRCDLIDGCGKRKPDPATRTYYTLDTPSKTAVLVFFVSINFSSHHFNQVFKLEFLKPL